MLTICPIRKWDFGPIRNSEIYGQTNPPDYDLSKILIPVNIYYGNADRTVNKTDVQTLIDALPNVPVAFEVPYDGFTHFDFVTTANAPEVLYYPIIEEMEKYVQQKRT
jgi:lysosomal acid lipase/cholesteryl ester hydrolase